VSEWVNLDVLDGVGPVALKRRRPREDETLLDHEATVLGAVDLPGVVHLVERRGGPAPALVTRFIGTHSLATAPPPDLDDTIAIVASLVDTVADLHRLGVRHGAIDPSHVLLGPGRRPVLCGFSRATLPGSPADESPTAAEDVAAIGRVMAGLLAGHDGLEPIPNRRSNRGRAWGGYRPRALLTLADHCQADEPGARPSAAGLAATISDLLDGGRTERREPRAHPAVWLRSVPGLVRARTSTWPRPRWGAGTGRRVLTLALAAVGLTAAAIAARSLRPASTDAASSGSAVSQVPTAITTSTTSTTMTTTTTRASCPSAAPDVGADLDGDGCPDGAVVIRDHTAVVAGEQFVLGRPGDRVLVGDWGCDGLVTAVLARADPPALWHFPTWARMGETVTARLVSEHVDPATVTGRPDDRGCDGLVATDARTGASIPVAVTP